MDISQLDTDDGKNILQTVRAMRTLFEDISKMLLTVDAMMRERGWEAAASNTCMADLSRTIQSPQYWGPSVVFRYFRHKQEPAALVAASVILDDLEQRDRVKEPLISGIVFDYGRGNRVPNDWRYDYAGFHIWISAGTDDGQPISVDPKVEWAEDKVSAARVTSFAVPLVEIKDSEVLRDRIVVPLNRIARTA